MVAPPDQSTNKHCPVCGELNDLDIQVCVNCGSEFDNYPIADDEADDWLHSRLAASPEDQDKIPTNQLQTPEPDFVFGQPTEQDPPHDEQLTGEVPLQDEPTRTTNPGHGTLPAWLSHAGQPKSGEAVSALPDWLPHAAPTPGQVGTTLPDWLSSGPAPASMPAPEVVKPSESLPETAELEDITLGSAIDWLSADSAEQQAPADDDSAVDWLADIVEDDAAGPEETESELDWLDSQVEAGLFEPTHSETEDDELPLPELFGDTAPDAELPSFLAKDLIEDEPSEEDVADADVFDLVAADSEDHEGEETLIEEGVPDWLDELESPVDEAIIAVDSLPESDIYEQPETVTELAAEEVAPPEFADTLDSGDESPAEEAILAAETLDASEATDDELVLDTPEWLAEIEDLPVDSGDTQPAFDIEPGEPDDRVSPFEKSDVPDWLSSAQQGYDPLLPETEEYAVRETGELDDDWTKGAEDPVAEAGAAPEEMPNIEMEAPDWLSELEEDIEPDQPGEDEPIDEAQEPVAAISVEEAELDDAGLLLDTEPGDSEPEWLSDLTDETVTDDKLPESDVDWLVGMTADTPAQEQGLEIEAVDEVPDWMAELSDDAPGEPEAEEEAAIPAEGEIVPSPSLPGIDAELDALFSPVPLDELDTPAEASPPPLAAGDDMSWLESLDSAFEDEDISLPDVSLDGEDLLGFSGDTLAVKEDEEEDLALGEVTEWIQELQAASRIPAVTEAEEVSQDYLEKIQELRYEAITGRIPGTEPRSPETIGALKDVAGVIPPEMIFEGSTLTTSSELAKAIDAEVLTEQVDRVKRLLGQENIGVGISGARRRVPILRWLVVLLLVAVLGVTSFTGIGWFDDPIKTTGVSSAYDTLDALTGQDASILIVFDYEPDFAAEMKPIASAVLAHLAEDDSATVYTISTRATGPAMAEVVLQSNPVAQRVGASTNAWQNLGYVSGGINGISNLVTSPAGSLPSPLSTDYTGSQLDSGLENLSGGQVNAVVILTSRYDNLKAWVEQVSPVSDAKIVAGLSASVSPLAQPYFDNDQISGVISGINDALVYSQVSTGQVQKDTVNLWNTQILGSAAVAVLIILGALVNGFIALREKQEQH